MMNKDAYFNINIILKIYDGLFAVFSCDFWWITYGFWSEIERFFNENFITFVWKFSIDFSINYQIFSSHMMKKMHIWIWTLCLKKKDDFSLHHLNFTFAKIFDYHKPNFPTQTHLWHFIYWCDQPFQSFPNIY